MKFIKPDIPGVYIIEPSVFGDERGYFLESFNLEKLSNIINTSRLFVAYYLNGVRLIDNL